MSKKYYVSTQTQHNGDNEVHTEGCPFPAKPEHQKDLGVHNTCHTAVVEARRYYGQVNGCKFCCLPCHTQ